MRLRQLKAVGLGLLALGLLWLVLVRGYADYMARVDPQRSVWLNPSQPEALARLAEKALVDERLEDAERNALDVISNAPFEGRAFRVLGAIADLRGQNEHAGKLMEYAARVSPRDAPTQFWLVLQGIARRDLDGAMSRIDRLLRFQPEALGRIMPLLNTFAANPASAGKLAKVVATSPKWRGTFFSAFTVDAPSTTHLAMFVNAMRRVGSDLTANERKDWISRLAKDSDWPRLKRELNASGTQEVSMLGNGAFERDGESLFGDWTFSRTPGAEIGLTQKVGGVADRALRLQFFGSRIVLLNPQQWILLDQGAYQLRGKVRLENLETARGLTWVVHCLPAQGQALAQSDLLNGNHDWTEFAFDFVVPADNCGAQQLRLEIGARIAAERQIEGVAWFDEIEIVKKSSLGG